MKDFKYTINGKSYRVKVNRIDQASAELEVNGKTYEVELEEPVVSAAPVAAPAPAPKPQPVVASTTPAPAPKTATGEPVISKPTVDGGTTALKSPLPGVIVDVLVKVGDEVKKGQKVLILEAMKMENNINADRDGKVVAIKVSKGDSIMEGTDLILIG